MKSHRGSAAPFFSFCILHSAFAAMLSRVADCLYWMSRYVERAENIARIVDVNRQVMLDLPYDQAQELDRNWFSMLVCLGDEDEFQERGHNPDRASVTEFVVFDRENSNSIV